MKAMNHQERRKSIWLAILFTLIPMVLFGIVVNSLNSTGKTIDDSCAGELEEIKAGVKEDSTFRQMYHIELMHFDSIWSAYTDLNEAYLKSLDSLSNTDYRDKIENSAVALKMNRNMLNDIARKHSSDEIYKRIPAMYNEFSLNYKKLISVREDLLACENPGGGVILPTMRFQLEIEKLKIQIAGKDNEIEHLRNKLNNSNSPVPDCTKPHGPSKEKIQQRNEEELNRLAQLERLLKNEDGTSGSSGSRRKRLEKQVERVRAEIKVYRNKLNPK